MSRLSILRGLGPIDAKSIGRDAMLRWVFLIPILIALMARWFLPSLLQQLETVLGVELLPYYQPLMAYMLLLLVPNLIGFVTGFLLLDQRDDRTLTALLVTPLSLKGYLIYRMLMPMSISFLLTLIALPISGLVSLDWPILLLTILSAAPMAPIFALALASLSQNKVQGFALMKISGLVLMPPLAAYFIQSKWEILLGFVPTYWPAKVLWTAETDAFWFYLLAGFGYQLLCLALLARRFEKIMHR